MSILIKYIIKQVIKQAKHLNKVLKIVCWNKYTKEYSIASLYSLPEKSGPATAEPDNLLLFITAAFRALTGTSAAPDTAAGFFRF